MSELDSPVRQAESMLATELRLFAQATVGAKDENIDADDVHNLSEKFRLVFAGQGLAEQEVAEKMELVAGTLSNYRHAYEGASPVERQGLDQALKAAFEELGLPDRLYDDVARFANNTVPERQVNIREDFRVNAGVVSEPIAESPRVNPDGLKVDQVQGLSVPNLGS